MYIKTNYSEYKSIKKDKRTNNLRIYILSMQDLIIKVFLKRSVLHLGTMMRLLPIPLDSMLPCFCSVIDHRWRQNAVRTSVTHEAYVTDILTTFWRHLWSITEQTHGNIESICFFCFFLIKYLRQYAHSHWSKDVFRWEYVNTVATSLFLCFPGTIWNHFKAGSLNSQVQIPSNSNEENFSKFWFGDWPSLSLWLV